MDLSVDEFWTALLVCDTNFPGGSLAHSQGLESAFQCNLLKNYGDLKKYIYMILENIISSSIPIVLACQDIFRFNADMDLCIKFFLSADTVFHASLTNEAARRASIMQGKAFLKVISCVFTTPKLMSFHKNVLQSGANFHFPAVFGSLCGLIGLRCSVAVRMFLRTILRDLTGCATRLNIIGCIRATKLQIELSPVIERILLKSVLYNEHQRKEDNTECVIIRDEERSELPERYYPVQTSIIIDTMQAKHDSHYSRLFNS